MAIFLIFLGLTTLNGTTITSKVQLALFYFLLILKVVKFQKSILILVAMLRVILVLEAVMVSLIAWFLSSWGAQEIANRNWWYFAAFPLSILSSSLLLDKEEVARVSRSQLISESQEIEMQDLSSKRHSKSYDPEEKEMELQEKLKK